MIELTNKSERGCESFNKNIQAKYPKKKKNRYKEHISIKRNNNK